MKEIVDFLVWVAMAYILFIFLRGMNETQVQKHLENLDKQNKNKEKTNDD
jgi:large-conductance mechanosensitive channel